MFPNYNHCRSRGAGIWPFAGICCLGLVGFLIAATIILSLIPLYVEKKEDMGQGTALGKCNDDDFETSVQMDSLSFVCS